MSSTLIIVIAAAAVVVALVAGFAILWKVPAADQALIITGLGSRRTVTGSGALVIPILQKAQYLSLRADSAELHVEGVDKQKIPVGVKGVAIFKVGDDVQSITNAGTRFLDDPTDETGQMHTLVKEVFHGHLRSIIGGLSVEDLIANRNELAQETRDASLEEMQKLGLVVDSMQIQEIIDPTGYIMALGEPRTAEVKKQARIAQAAADREATEREQEAATLRAAAERDTAIKLAAFKAERDRAEAEAAQSGPLADASARKEVVVQETAVANLVSEREEKRLDAQVRKPADAEAYRQRVEAEGQREARIALAEAAKREVELKAEADARRVELSAAADAKRVKQVGEAEADATRAKGDAEGSAVRATGLAEAEAIASRAEALEKQSDAVIGQQIAEKLPEIVAAAASSFAKVDNLTILNGAQGVGEILNQVIGQAGPALRLARETLGAATNGDVERPAAAGNGTPPAVPPASAPAPGS